MKYKIYQTRSEASEFFELKHKMTLDFKGEKIAELAEEGLRKGMYVHVADIEANDMNEVFQIGNIGPEERIDRKADMYSISVGDLIEDENGSISVVAAFGFIKLETNMIQNIRDKLRGYHAALSTVLMEEHGFDTVMYFPSADLPENVTLSLQGAKFADEDESSEWVVEELSYQFGYCHNGFQHHEIKGDEVLVTGIDWDVDYEPEGAIGSYSVDPKTGKAFDIHGNYENAEDIQADINKHFPNAVFIKVHQSEIEMMNDITSMHDDTRNEVKDLARKLIKEDAELNSVTQTQEHKM